MQSTQGISITAKVDAHHDHMQKEWRVGSSQGKPTAYATEEMGETGMLPRIHGHL